MIFTDELSAGIHTTSVTNVRAHIMYTYFSLVLHLTYKAMLGVPLTATGLNSFSLLRNTAA